MSDRLARIFSLLGAAALLLLAVACTQAGPLRTDSERVELGEAETVRAEIAMGAGELNLTGGAAALLEADFTYNVTEWAPEVDYQIDGDRGILEVRQPGDLNVGWVDEYRYEWDLRFHDDVPLDLRVILGAGQSRLDLADLALKSLDLDLGAGDVTVDLAREWAYDLEAVIEGGVGELTLFLPTDVGVEVQVQGGLGGLNAAGFERDGDRYVNAAYGVSNVTLSVSVAGGVGEVNLELAD